MGSGLAKPLLRLSCAGVALQEVLPLFFEPPVSRFLPLKKSETARSNGRFCAFLAAFHKISQKNAKNWVVEKGYLLAR
jgi:hypothetical protein